MAPISFWGREAYTSVCRCLCVWLCVHICVYACGVLRTSLAVIPQLLSIIYFETLSLIGWSLVSRPGGLATKLRDPPAFAFPVYPN